MMDDTTPQYLTRQERIERKDRLRKQREELRNAIRFTIKEGGIDPRSLNEAAKDMAKDAVKKATQSVIHDKGMDSIIRRVVREEMQALCRHETMAKMIQEMIRGEAQRVAKEFIDQNLVVKMNSADW